MALGPFFRNDPGVREAGQPYPFRAVAPFVCPETLRLLHPNVPIVNYNRHLAARGGRGPDIPAWAHSQLPEERARAARLGRSVENRAEMLARWVPCMPPRAVADDDFWCAVYRMEWLDVLRQKLESDTSEDRLPRDAILQVVLLQDMNQMRLLLMDSLGMYTREGCEVVVGKAAYDVHYGTTLANIMHCGMLPDLASIHAKLPFWDKPTETFARMSVPFEHDEVANTLVHIFTKVTFQPSKMRELNKCIYDEITRMTARQAERPAERDARLPPAVRFMLILQRLVFCSLGGYYPHAEYIPSAVMRRELYRRYMFDVMPLTSFKTWVIQNKRLLTMVLRENHIYNLAAMPGLESVFVDMYEYRNIRNKTLHAIETVRATIDASLRTAVDEVAGRAVAGEAGAATMRAVYRAHFPLRCAMLSNTGDILWVFSTQCDTPAAHPALRDMLTHMFWRSTPVHEFADMLGKFECSAPEHEAERHMRMIVLYWLILRDRCNDQSMKKTQENYRRCVARLGAEGVFLLPEFPGADKKLKRGGMRRDRTGVASDAVVTSDARAAEAFVVEHMRCTRHDAPVRACKCLIATLLAVSAEFDVYRFTQPKTWSARAVAVGAGIEQYMWHMYDACLVWCYRPRQTSFAEEIVSSAASVCNVFSSAASLAAEPPKRGLPAARVEYAAFVAAHTAFKTTRNAMRARMLSIVNALPPDAGVSFEWLIEEYKVGLQSVFELDDAYRMMMGESHHKYPYNAMMRIARTAPRDFWIVRLLYKVIHQRESIRVYPLWADLARQQINAIHTQTNAVRPGAPLPPVLGRVHYCPSHRRILAPVVGADLGHRGRVNTHAVGAERIVMNPITGVKYCGVRTGRIKRRCVPDAVAKDAPDAPPLTDDPVSSGVAEIESVDTMLRKLPPKVRKFFQDEDVEMPDASDSDENMDVSDTDGEASMGGAPDAPGGAARKAPRKRRTKKRRFTGCGVVPVASVNMVGVLFMLYNNMYLLCPFCGHVMRYGRDKFCEIGLWCGACVQGERALAEKLGVPWDELNECADPTLVPDTVCGVQVVRTRDAGCYYCGEVPPSARPLSYYLVYNDLGAAAAPAMGMAYVGMCENHAKWWIGKGAVTMRLSTVLHNFRLMDAAYLADSGSMGTATQRAMPRTLALRSGEEVVTISLPFESLLETVGEAAAAQRERDAEHRAGVKRKRAADNAVRAGLKRAKADKKGKGKQRK